jgi:hypothetical protein
MKVVLHKAPQDILDAAIDWLRRAAWERTLLIPSLRGDSPEEIALSTWHRMLEVGLDDLLAGKPLEESAREVGWRFLVHANTSVVAAMEVRTADDGGQLPPSLTEDRSSIGTVDGIASAEKFPVDGDWAYEFSFIAIPAIQVWGLWMRFGSAPEWIEIIRAYHN